jgi:hypothetical protein
MDDGRRRRVYSIITIAFCSLGLSIMAFSCDLSIVDSCVFYEGILGNITRLSLQSHDFTSCSRNDDVYTDQDCYSLVMNVDYSHGSCEFSPLVQNNYNVAKNIMDTYHVGGDIGLLRNYVDGHCYSPISIAHVYDTGFAVLGVGLLLVLWYVVLYVRHVLYTRGPEYLTVNAIEMI